MSQQIGLFGLNSQLNNSSLAIIPVPWEVTTSYGSGTSKGPQAILQASPQLDLYTYDPNETINAHPIFLCEESIPLAESNKINKLKAQKIIHHLESQPHLTADLKQLLNEVNLACEDMTLYVYKTAKDLISKNKKVAVIGGDHSSPLGLIKALSEKNNNYDVLHIDAHLDLRNTYQGFKQSHASIMYNALQLNNPPQNLVSVGIRDFCKEEMSLVKESKTLTTFTDQEIQSDLFSGLSWLDKTNEIISNFKNPTYISFDIDGLDPKYCPNTGTPVPGGLSFNQASFLVKKLSQKVNIIGFDLCEVSPSQDSSSEWDGNVGSRVLFTLYKSMFN